MNKRTKYRTRKNEEGFTLAELMTVIVLSTMTVSFIFFLFIDQSRLALTQAEIGDLQTSLQFSVASLQRDLRRAGFMSIVTNADKRLCQAYTSPNNDFNAINFRNADPLFGKTTTVKPVNSSNPNKFIQPDSIELFGNFTTTTDFPAYINPSNPSEVIVNFAGTSIADLPSFERSFFSPNQLLMVKGQTGRLHIIQVKTSGAKASSVYQQGTNSATLKISNTLKLVNTTNCGVAIRFRVAPLHKIRYRIRATTATSWQLVREVMDPGTCTSSGSCAWTIMGDKSPHPPLEIAPNAVDLQFWFSTWNNVTNQPQNLDPMCRTATCSKSGAQLNDDSSNYWPSDPSSIRSIFFRITVRTENEDPSLQFFPRSSATKELINYDIDPNKNGAARIRSIVKNVTIPNMLVR